MLFSRSFSVMTSSIRSPGAALMLLVFVAALLVGPRPAAAQFLFENRWINAGTGDGYDVENWDQVDTTVRFILDDIDIDNGGEAVFSFHSPLRDDVDQDDDIASLRVGSRTSAEDPESVSGAMVMNDLDLIVFGQTEIGHDRFQGSTNGRLTINAGPNASGDLFVERDLLIGGDASRLTRISPGAHGEVSIDGSLGIAALSPVDNRVVVGQGRLDVGGDISGFPFVSVNGRDTDPGIMTVGGRLERGRDVPDSRVSVGSISNQVGELEVGSGIFDFDAVEVGTNSGNGSLEILSGGLGGPDPLSDGTLLPEMTIGGGGFIGSESRGAATIVGDVNTRVLSVGRHNAVGGLSVDGDVRVGSLVARPSVDEAFFVGLNNAAGNATGDVHVTGDVHARIRVGATDDEGFVPLGDLPVSAHGRLRVDGDVTASGGLDVGFGDIYMPGDVQGEVTIGGELFVASANPVRVGYRRAGAGGAGILETPPTTHGSVNVAGGTHFEGGNSLLVGVSSDAATTGRFETEGITGRLRGISAGSRFLAEGTRGEVVVRSGGIQSSSSVGGIIAGARDMFFTPDGLVTRGSVGIVDITGDLAVAGGWRIDVQHDDSAVILREGESSRLNLVGIGRDSFMADTGGASRLELHDYVLETTSLFVGSDASLAVHLRSDALRSTRVEVAGEADFRGSLIVHIEDMLPAGIYDLVTAQTITGNTDLTSLITLIGLDPSVAQFNVVPSTTVSGDSGFAIRLTIIPEPSTALLLGLGLASLSRKRRRR